jgi:predicted aspartyl protease
MPYLRCCVMLVVVLAASACNPTGAPARVEAPADSASGETAFELAGPGGAALIVPVFLNGQGPFQFVLDTGATVTCVDVSLAEELSLPEARGVVGAGATVQGSGQMRIIEIDSVRVGSARVEGLLGCAIDLQHTSQIGLEIDGLLGLNFLKPFRMTLDFERSVLLLQDPS